MFIFRREKPVYVQLIQSTLPPPFPVTSTPSFSHHRPCHIQTIQLQRQTLGDSWCLHTPSSFIDMVFFFAVKESWRLKLQSLGRRFLFWLLAETMTQSNEKVADKLDEGCSGKLLILLMQNLFNIFLPCKAVICSFWYLFSHVNM